MSFQVYITLFYSDHYCISWKSNVITSCKGWGRETGAKRERGGKRGGQRGSEKGPGRRKDKIFGLTTSNVHKELIRSMCAKDDDPFHPFKTVEQKRQQVLNTDLDGKTKNREVNSSTGVENLRGGPLGLLK